MKKRFLAYLLMVLMGMNLLQPYCNNFVSAEQSTTKVIFVSTTESLEDAIEKVQPSTRIVMKDGNYKDINFDVTAKASVSNPIIIEAEHPGKVVFSGDVKIVISGDYITLRGVYFKDGNRNTEEWQPHGPGLITIYGDHNRVTECAIHNFDLAESAWIATNVRENDKHVPMYNRIDHNSFTDKVTNDQVINLNNVLVSEKKVAKGTPMYNRVDHNYFSNPPKIGNAGGGIRVGYFINDIGRCLVDNNLFERQDSEPEVITSKSRENLYLNNTYKNCQGTMNFRHGSYQVATGNHFIANDDLHEYGGMYIWGQGHTVTNNLFSISNPFKRTNSALSLSPGISENEHSLAHNSLFAENIFINRKSASINFNPDYDVRVNYYKKKGFDEIELPHHNQFINNAFVSIGEAADYPIFINDFTKDRSDIWEENVVVSNNLGNNMIGNMVNSAGEQGYISKTINESDVNVETISNLVESKVAYKALISEEVKKAFKDNFDIVIDEIIQEPIQEKEALSYDEVGPSWLTTNPSSYAIEGQLSQELADQLLYVEKQRELRKGRDLNKYLEDCPASMKPIKITHASEKGRKVFNPKYSPQKALDRDLFTKWYGDKTEWIQFELDHVSQVSHIGMSYMKGNKKKYSFEIFTSKDGTNWTSVLDANSNGKEIGMEYYELGNIEAKYIKVIPKGHVNNDGKYTSDYFHLLEFGAYEASDGSAIEEKEEVKVGEKNYELDTLYFTQTFKDYVGSKDKAVRPDGWKVGGIVSNENYLIGRSIEGKAEKSINLHSGVKGKLYMEKSIPNLTGRLVAEADVMVNQTEMLRYVLQFKGVATPTKGYSSVAVKQGNFSYLNKQLESLETLFEAGKWYNIKQVLDTENDIVEVYIDDVKINKIIKLEEDWESINAIKVLQIMTQTEEDAGESGELYINSIKLYSIGKEIKK